MPKSRSAAALLTVALLAGVAPALAQQPDALLLQRQRDVPKTRPWPIEWFQPQEAVRGGSGVEARVVPQQAGDRVNRVKLEEAGQYARARGTQAFFVWHEGKVVWAEYGQGTDPEKPVNTYYMHLTPLVLLFGIAKAEGKIGSIDEPAAKYLPEWKNDDRSRITLRQLLTMSAGLEMYFDNKDPLNKNTRLFFAADSTAPAFEYPAIAPPDTEFAYNYLIPELLGIILERATGRRYAEYLSEKLWQPLGNSTAHVWLDRPGGRPHFNSSLFAVSRDWLNIGVLLAQGGKFGGRQVVPADWIEEMRKPSRTNPNYGMIWLGQPHQQVRSYAKDVRYLVKSSAPYAAPDLFFLDGYGGQRVYVVPSRKLVIVRIGAPQRDDWDDSVLPNTVLAAVP